MSERQILLSSVLGNSQKLDGGAMFGNAPKPLWSRWVEPDELNRVPLACRCALLEIGDSKVLLETGIGAFMAPKLAERFGIVEETAVLPQSLQELKLSPGDIDFVILSHLHFDHAGGLLSQFHPDKSPQLIFDKARFVVGEEAFARSQEPHSRDRASFIPDLAGLLQASGRLQVLCEGQSIEELPELSFFVSHGHTPGQMHTVVTGNRHKLVYCGDLIPGTAWMHLPITMGYDRFPELLIDEKQQLYQRADASWLFFFTHDSEYAAAGVERNEKGRYTPKGPVSQFVRFAL